MPDLFAQVILPLSLHNSFTYKVPEGMQEDVRPGRRVIVQFGKSRLYAALVISMDQSFSGDFSPKEILQVLDQDAIILPQNLNLWEWMSTYYCCTLGDVFRAALPAGLKMESKSRLVFSGKSEEDVTGVEQGILDEVKKEAVALEDLQKRMGSRFSYQALKSLQKKELIYVEEKVSQRYKPKTESLIAFHSDIQSKEILNQRLEGLRRAKKQCALTKHFFDLVKPFEREGDASVLKKELFENTAFNSTHVRELIKKGIFVQYEKRVSRLDKEEVEQVEMNMLNPFQAEAYEQIQEGFQEGNIMLVHGVTASGKTEIYIHLIQEAIQAGKQALYLVPEIALTTQIIKRLKGVFGNKVGIYHSRLSNQERVEVWEKVLAFEKDPDSGYQVVLGARSAIFLPFHRLGIIIVDEEHENSYKQFDPAPRYNARDMAVVLGRQHQARILLGSATPSYESYHNSHTGKYKLVKIEKRHNDVALPEVVVADLRKAYKQKRMRSVLSPELYELVEEALSRKEQVILFQNRRGYSPFVECLTCGWIPRCQRCDVSLTYHKYKKVLNCHYCGHTKRLNDTCDDCGSPEVKTRGFGTEKIEQELKGLFRNARIQRMDLDTTSNKNAFEKIVTNLETGKTDILVGTQMVTKGLDFENVSVVGILNADNLINYPDFRAHERAYQLISQVSGRAGRKHGNGKVVIQTTQHDHPVIKLIQDQDYLNLLRAQLAERQLFRYPPYYKLIKLIVKSRDERQLEGFAISLANELRLAKEFTVLGPEAPLVSRIKLWYIKEIWIKLKPGRELDNLKHFINQKIARVKNQPGNSTCLAHIDVDPM